MTTFKPFSMQSVTLTPAGPDPVSALTMTGSSSLMENYQASRPVDSQHSVRVVEDITGNPIVFSVGTNGHLFAVVHDPSEKTGWKQYDVTGAINADANVETFDVVATASGTYSLAVSLRAGETSTVYVNAQALAADPSQDYWASFSTQLTARPDGLGITQISRLSLGAAVGSNEAVVMALASKDGTTFDRYMVGDAAGPWTLWALPENPERRDGSNPIVDVKFGTHPKFKVLGTYSLYYVGDDLEVTFDSLQPVGGQIVSHQVQHLPTGAAALAVVDVPGAAGSDLFVAGDTIAHYSCAVQQGTSDHEVPETVATIAADDAHLELEALADAETIALWFLNGGVLSYVAGTTGNWSTPVPLKKQDVGQIAAVRNTVKKTNELIEITADQTLSYQYQDPNSTIWREVEIPLVDTGNAVSFQSYTTVLGFAGPQNAPWSGQTVKLSATDWCMVTVNGQAHILDVGSDIPVQTDITGKVTILSKIDSASTPMIAVTSPGFAEVIDVNPHAVVNDALRPFTTVVAVQKARTQTDQPLLGANAKIAADQFANANAHIVQAADAATAATLSVRTPGAGPSNVIDSNKLKSSSVPQAMAVFYHADGVRTLTGADAQAKLPARNALALGSGLPVGGDIKAVFGDVWQSISHGLEEVGGWILNVADDGLEFALHLASGTVTFLLDTIEKVYQTFSWIMEQIGAGLDKLLDWLGQLLGWDDVMTVQGVLTNTVNKLLDWAVTDMVDMKQQFDTSIDGFSEKISGFELPDEIANATPTSFITGQTQTLDQQNGDQRIALDSPAGSFATYHVQHSVGMDGDPAISVSLSDALHSFLNDLEQPATQLASGIATFVNDIAEGLEAGTLTIGAFLQKITNDLVTQVLAVAKGTMNAAMDVLADIVTAIKSILNAKVELPFLTGLFKAISGGQDISLLNVFTLLLSVPVTTGLHLLGAGYVIEAVRPLSDPTLSVEAFMALITPASAPQGVMQDAIAMAEDTISTPIALSYLLGMISVIAETVDNGVTLAVATAEELTILVGVTRTLSYFVYNVTTFPIAALADPGSAASIARYVSFAVRLVGTLGPMGLIIPAAGGAISGVANLTIGAIQLLVGFVVGIISVSSAALRDGFSGAALAFVTAFGHQCAALVRALMGIVSFANAVGEATVKTAMKVTGVILALLIGLKTLVDCARLVYVMCDDQGKPYYA